MYTPFWYNQPSVLYDRHFIFEFFPMKEYDLIRKLNAILRFTIYYSVAMYCYSRNTNYFGIPIIAAFITFLMWKKNPEIQKDQAMTDFKNDVPTLVSLKDHNIGCSLPNKDNPFMNPMFYDVAADKELPKSCTSYDNKGIQRKIEKEFDKGLYRNYTDIFKKENSQRQFFTVPGREGIPDQSAFAHWLYRTPDTCKEGNSLACLSVGDGNGGGQGVPG
jgi:hypothetical protein